VDKKVLIISGLLSVLAVSLIGYKVWFAGYSFVPRSSGDTWSVELQIRFMGEKRRGSVRANLPLSDSHQVIFDARNHSPHLQFYFRQSEREGTNILGVWAGSAKEVQTASYRFSVKTRPFEVILPQQDTTARYTTGVARWLRESREVPFRDPAIQELITEIAPSRANKVAVVGAAYDFVRNEIAFTASKDQMDALIALDQKQANSRGKARLMCALCRAARIPCRIIGGLILAEGATDDLHLWNEVYLGGEWIPICPTRGYLGKVPRNYLVLRTGGEPILEGIGTKSFSYLFTVARQPETLLQLYTGNSSLPEGFLRHISLFSLPVKTQIFFRILLLIPVGALVVTIFRNIIGVPSFGIFTPVLIAIAFRDTGFAWGILFLSIVVVLGISFRYFLDRLQLLLVPRLAFLLSMVVLILLGISLTGGEIGTAEAASVALFPIVIMTTVIERFSITLAEEGTRAAIIRTFWTMVIALAGYGVMAVQWLQFFLFAFPEGILIVMTLLLLVGRYTGYRVNDLIRFRSLATS
jgi:hypothetical protein